MAESCWPEKKKRSARLNNSDFKEMNRHLGTEGLHANTHILIKHRLCVHKAFSLLFLF